ncbi:MAG: flagellar basal body-associated FliL family protein [Leptospirales bacterium]|nr:flagellar basal body-associated FliL family protein [Leptospirales bacterium]
MKKVAFVAILLLLSRIGFAENRTGSVDGIAKEKLFPSYVTENKDQRNQDIIAAPPPEPLALYELPTFTLTTADTEPRFVKMTISLGYVPDQNLSSELINRRSEIQHIVNIILEGKTFEDLNSVEKTITLSEEIKSHINMRLINGMIKEVYFIEFVIH